MTLVLVFRIPACGNAGMYEFDDGRFYWLLDYPVSYHQILANKQLRVKLVFAGPGASMYIPGIMICGPVNGQIIFIQMMGNVNGE